MRTELICVLAKVVSRGKIFSLHAEKSINQKLSHAHQHSDTSRSSTLTPSSKQTFQLVLLATYNFLQKKISSNQTHGRRNDNKKNWKCFLVISLTGPDERTPSHREPHTRTSRAQRWLLMKNFETEKFWNPFWCTSHIRSRWWWNVARLFVFVLHGFQKYFIHCPQFLIIFMRLSGKTIVYYRTFMKS
jgi:hypothetical protein